jgi:4-hydroxybenzoate polyprenyltransferase
LPQILSQPESPTVELKPLCVDLDGTLVKSDTLVDSLLVLARTHPHLLLRLPAQVLRGKAAFKAFVTENVPLDVVHLPYNRKLLQFLEAEHAQGREIYLATGADVHLARRVADHLGLFHEVLASDGTHNLTGNKKLDSLRNLFGNSDFIYVGNDTPDLPVMAGATESMVANPSRRLRTKLRAQGISPSHAFEERSQPLRAFIKALRPHQWAKNLLIFVPLLCSHALSTSSLLIALAAFCCFSLTASSAYIVNDLLDIETDRRHPRKRLRPFASGDLSAFAGIFIAALCLVVGLGVGRELPGGFYGWLLVYLATTLAYSSYLKRIALVDVLTLSGLYILRLLAGAAATQTPISHWLEGFSMFLFLSLAIVKRFAELENLRASSSTPRNGRGYLLADISQMRSFGNSSGMAAVVVFAIYISGADVARLYHQPRLLWLIVPCMILWINRVWLLASRGQLDEDPVAFALTDRMSQLIGVAVVVIALLAL